MQPETAADDPLVLLQALFQQVDADADGRINAAELSAALVQMGQQVPHDEASRLIASVDRDKDGRLEFREFVELISPPDLGDDPDEDVRQAFAVLDTDGDGYLTLADLRAAVQRLGGQLGGLDVEAVLQTADRDGDHRISFDEFAKMMFAG